MRSTPNDPPSPYGSAMALAPPYKRNIGSSTARKAHVRNELDDPLGLPSLRDQPVQVHGEHHARGTHVDDDAVLGPESGGRLDGARAQGSLRADWIATSSEPNVNTRNERFNVTAVSSKDRAPAMDGPRYAVAWSIRPERRSQASMAVVISANTT
jgi:hypothetical protein